jgi:Xaa-Pro aminopeptidase
MRINLLFFTLFNALFSLNMLAQNVPTPSKSNVPHFKISAPPSIPEELTSSFFFENRERLREILPDSSMVVLFSAPIRKRTNDIDYPFHQDPDFYYFTGVNEDNAMLILFKNPMRINEKWYREILFIENDNMIKQVWNGPILGSDQAKEVSGVATVLSNTEFKTMDFKLDEVKNVYSNNNLFIELDDVKHPGDLASMVNHFKIKTARAGKEILVNEGEDLYAKLRQKKSKEELEMMQRAIDITGDAHSNVMRMVRPGMTEYQLEAMIEYTFKYNGAVVAFPSIVASGDNGAIMHYTENSDLLIPGDLVIMDIGAEYEGYAADITRTIPVSGVFTEEQKQIYQLVLDAQTVAIRYATKGYKFWTPHEEAYRTIGKGLIALGIITEWGDIGRYFMHGTSHYLGLDVHDAGLYSALQPGEVITVEPGIYIPKGSPCNEKWWGIFVRIEDDILITDGPAKILSERSPRKISEIEALMSSESALNE